MFRAILLTLIAQLVHSAPSASLILKNGILVTESANQPRAEAVAIAGKTILAVGSNAEIQKLARPETVVIDLAGKLAIPGFIEGHGHFMGVGQSKISLNLRNARNWDEIIALVAEAARKSPPGAWILGRGFHQSKWDTVPAPDVQGFPVHAGLSKVSPNNPVWLTHASGHASMVNAAALKQAEISAKTPDPAGGQILKDAQGEPSGLLQEQAQALLEPAYQAYRARLTPEQLRTEGRRVAELAANEAIVNGITSFQDAGSSFETVDLLRELAEEGKLRVRLWVMLRVPNAQLEKNIHQYRIQDAASGYLTVRAIKRAMDGALGSRGAWILAPYTDLPESSGINTESPDDIRRTAEIAMRNGFQLCVHAIGDRANREVLDIYEREFRRRPDQRDLRWRIEHAQHLDEADIPRFGKLGVIAAMQGVHCTSDAPYVIPRLGFDRARKGAYVWRKLLDSGAVVGNGTDAPVEELNPIASFYASVTRRSKDGAAFFPEQRMTREETLKSYTLSNAFAAFEETRKGSLEPGKLADITVLSKDILSVPDEQIPTARVLYTIVGGKVAYRGQ